MCKLTAVKRQYLENKWLIYSYKNVDNFTMDSECILAMSTCKDNYEF